MHSKVLYCPGVQHLIRTAFSIAPAQSIRRCRDVRLGAVPSSPRPSSSPPCGPVYISTQPKTPCSPHQWGPSILLLLHATLPSNPSDRPDPGRLLSVFLEPSYLSPSAACCVRPSPPPHASPSNRTIWSRRLLHGIVSPFPWHPWSLSMRPSSWEIPSTHSPWRRPVIKAWSGPSLASPTASAIQFARRVISFMSNLGSAFVAQHFLIGKSVDGWGPSGRFDQSEVQPPGEVREVVADVVREVGRPQMEFLHVGGGCLVVGYSPPVHDLAEFKSWCDDPFHLPWPWLVLMAELEMRPVPYQHSIGVFHQHHVDNHRASPRSCAADLCGVIFVNSMCFFVTPQKGFPCVPCFL